LNQNKIIYWLIMGVFILTGCRSCEETGQIIDPGVLEPSQPTDLPVDTPTPLAPVGVLLTPAGSDQELAADLNTIIGSYIRDQELRYQVLTDLTDEDFVRDEYRIVVALPPNPGIAELAQNFPDTKFLAVGFNDLEPGDNLTW